VRERERSPEHKNGSFILVWTQKRKVRFRIFNGRKTLLADGRPQPESKRAGQRGGPRLSLAVGLTSSTAKGLSNVVETAAGAAEARDKSREKKQSDEDQDEDEPPDKATFPWQQGYKQKTNRAKSLPGVSSFSLTVVLLTDRNGRQAILVGEAGVALEAADLVLDVVLEAPRQSP